METLTIAQLREQAGETPFYAEIDVQLQSRHAKTTRTNKPYLELSFADSTASFSLKLWEDRSLFTAARDWPDGVMIRLAGKWTQNQYGLEGNDLHARVLSKEERELFLTGDVDLQLKQHQDWQNILEFCQSLQDPRLALLTQMFIEKFGDHFRRTAAARKNHHARRGGLVEHVAQMMRAGEALCRIYPQWHRDLLIAGVLFHDCGKLWENSYPRDGFTQIHSMRGEMLGHIPIGIEVVNSLWREMMESDMASDWLTLEPHSEEVRLHLLHLIASHHGQYEFGSPTLPRTPEAFALHFIDNIDAKMEMLKDAYANANEIAPNIYEKQFPLPANLVRPLRGYESPMLAEEVGDDRAELPTEVDENTELIS
jgi:3'-5' exoribonuclease